MNKIIITNIQRFSLQDGPGIRTTVFLKGCSIRCPWCCNPENINGIIEKVDNRVYGKNMSCEEILYEVLKDRVYYGQWSKESSISKPQGGITFSGGEALLQIKAMVPLLKKIKEQHIHMCIETSLFASEELLNIAIQYIDLFYVDIKILDADRCTNIIKGDINQYYCNLQMLFKAKVPVIFRVPVIGGYTDNVENKNCILEMIKKYKPMKVELLKGHNIGAEKYRNLHIQVPKYIPVSNMFLQDFKLAIGTLGIETEIYTI